MISILEYGRHRNSPYLSVFEALEILNDHKSIKGNAIRHIFVKCNIPENRATLYWFQRKFKNALNDRTFARKNRKLDNWLNEAKTIDFCKHAKRPLSSDLDRSTLDK